MLVKSYDARFTLGWSCLIYYLWDIFHPMRFGSIGSLLMCRGQDRTLEGSVCFSSHNFSFLIFHMHQREVAKQSSWCMLNWEHNRKKRDSKLSTCWIWEEICLHISSFRQHLIAYSQPTFEYEKDTFDQIQGSVKTLIWVHVPMFHL